MIPEEDSFLFETGKKHLVEKWECQAQCAGAGDDEDGYANLERLGDSFSGGKPADAAPQRDDKDGDEVVAKDGVSVFFLCFRQGGFFVEEMVEEAVGEVVKCFHPDRMPGTVSGSGRNLLSCTEGDGIGFAVDPIEVKDVVFSEEFAVNGQHGPAGDLEYVSGFDFLERDPFAVPFVQPEGCGEVSLSSPELPPVFLQQAKVEPAP